MYLTSIFFYLTWPALIALSYWLIIVALKRYEKIQEPEEKELEIFITD